MQQVLEILLNKYADFGVTELENLKILEQKEFAEQFGGPIKVIQLFGGKKKYLNAIKELEQELYAA